MKKLNKILNFYYIILILKCNVIIFKDQNKFNLLKRILTKKIKYY